MISKKFNSFANKFVDFINRSIGIVQYFIKGYNKANRITDIESIRYLYHITDKIKEIDESKMLKGTNNPYTNHSFGFFKVDNELYVIYFFSVLKRSKITKTKDINNDNKITAIRIDVNDKFKKYINMKQNIYFRKIDGAIMITLKELDLDKVDYEIIEAEIKYFNVQQRKL